MGELELVLDESRKIAEGSRNTRWRLVSRVRCVRGEDLGGHGEGLGTCLLVRRSVEQLAEEGVSEDGVDVWIAEHRLCPEDRILHPSSRSAALRLAIETANLWHLHVAKIFGTFPLDVLARHECKSHVPRMEGGVLVAETRDHTTPA
jgi:hypothetical protein